MKRAATGALAALGMLLLILDSKTALTGAREAIELCLYTVIPPLFPFLVLSCLLNGVLLGRPIPILRPLGRLCSVPEGGESLLLLGLIGGYPVGAQAVADAYQIGCIEKRTYNRLLGFCNNAGPSFIFGIIASQFSDPVAVWLIWGIHILSALLVGTILPGRERQSCRLPKQDPVTMSAALNSSLSAMSKICGWVILFRVLIAYLKCHIPASFPQWAVTLLTGLLELTNGCVNLSLIESEYLRFLTCVCMLNFGGLCVAMQTISTCDSLGAGWYFPGKLLQTLLGFALACLFGATLYPSPVNIPPIIYVSYFGVIIALCYFSGKKQWQFRQKSFIINRTL